jgi:hypothetical protein
VILGGVTSFKVTENVQEAVFPFPSFAVSVTILTSLWPISTVDDAGLCVTVGLAAQLSLTEMGEKEPNKLLQLASAATVVLAGQTISGGVTSPMTTVVVPTPLHPFSVIVRE